MATAQKPQTGSTSTVRPATWWAPRMWLGTDLVAWLRLLSRNRFDIDLTHAHIAVTDGLVGALNTALRGVQQLVYGRAVARTTISEAPLFILGHWRCGTTLLHELLILDERHTYPNTYQCLSPNHFLLTERVLSRLIGFLMPPQRPMDNMPLGWSSPQEDEFALCNLGVPSPYQTIVFPNRPPQNQEYLDLEGVPPAELARWKAVFHRFLQEITCRNPRRIVLKSPPHTCRVKVLLEMFPDARFVYITRDPYVVLPSTLHLWQTLYQQQGLQRPRYEGLEEHVLETFARMFEQYEQTRALIGPSRLYELRYEELVADPVAQMQRLYATLELGGFDEARGAIEQYFAATKEYQTNRYQLSDAQREAVTRRWAGYLARYGYESR